MGQYGYHHIRSYPSIGWANSYMINSLYFTIAVGGHKSTSLLFIPLSWISRSSTKCHSIVSYYRSGSEWGSASFRFWPILSKSPSFLNFIYRKLTFLQQVSGWQLILSGSSCGYWWHDELFNVLMHLDVFDNILLEPCQGPKAEEDADEQNEAAIATSFSLIRLVLNVAPKQLSRKHLPQSGLTCLWEGKLWNWNTCSRNRHQPGPSRKDLMPSINNAMGRKIMSHCFTNTTVDGEIDHMVLSLQGPYAAVIEIHCLINKFIHFFGLVCFS